MTNTTRTTRASSATRPTMKRRSFLLGATGGALVAAGHAAAQALGADTPDEIATGRSAASGFRFADDKVPMNAANLCPMPAAVADAVASFQAELDVDMSGPSRGRVEALKGEARAGIAQLLGVQPAEIAIVRNTSEANNVIVQGLDLNAGDEVLLWDQNHPSNDVAWRVRAARDGIVIRHLSVPTDANTEDEVIDAFLNALTPRTRVVSFTHISNVTGFRLPANELCAALRRHSAELYLHVDGAQTWGAVDADLRAMDCDSFSGSAHKWLMGPREVGLLYVREARQSSLWPGVVSVPWGNEAEPSVPGAQRFEALGQRDDAAIAGLVATLSLHEELSPAEVERRSLAVSNRLRAALEDLEVPMVTSTNPRFASSVVILSAPREQRGALVEHMLNDAGVITAPVNGLRFSPHIYNTAEHVDRAASAVANVRHLLG